MAIPFLENDLGRSSDLQAVHGVPDVATSQPSFPRICCQNSVSLKGLSQPLSESLVNDSNSSSVNNYCRLNIIKAFGMMKQRRINDCRQMPKYLPIFGQSTKSLSKFSPKTTNSQIPNNIAKKNNTALPNSLHCRDVNRPQVSCENKAFHTVYHLMQ